MTVTVSVSKTVCLHKRRLSRVTSTYAIQSFLSTWWTVAATPCKQGVEATPKASSQPAEDSVLAVPCGLVAMLWVRPRAMARGGQLLPSMPGPLPLWGPQRSQTGPSPGRTLPGRQPAWCGTADVQDAECHTVAGSTGRLTGTCDSQPRRPQRRPSGARPFSPPDTSAARASPAGASAGSAAPRQKTALKRGLRRQRSRRGRPVLRPVSFRRGQCGGRGRGGGAAETPAGRDLCPVAEVSTSSDEPRWHPSP